ncbi:MAG: hypothetical protein ACP5NZ_01285 [Nanobdellota archaeon]
MKDYTTICVKKDFLLKLKELKWEFRKRSYEDVIFHLLEINDSYNRLKKTAEFRQLLSDGKEVNEIIQKINKIDSNIEIIAERAAHNLEIIYKLVSSQKDSNPN